MQQESQSPLPPTVVQSLFYGIGAGCALFVIALVIGWVEGKRLATLWLIGVAIGLETQPAAVASIPLGFRPLPGAVISILGNLIVLPVLFYALSHTVHRWKWMNKLLTRAEKWTVKYGRHGVWVLIPLCPVLGAYVCLAISFVMRWRARVALTSILVGMVTSTFFITYGGTALVAWFRS